MDPFDIDNNRQSSSLPLARSVKNISRIEARLYDALVPDPTETSSLNPKRFGEVLKDTRALLLEKVGNEKDEAVKETVNRLVKLLEENIELRSLLEFNLDRVRKV